MRLELEQNKATLAKVQQALMELEAVGPAGPIRPAGPASTYTAERMSVSAGT